jgi:hypothetical protein
MGAIAQCRNASLAVTSDNGVACNGIGPVIDDKLAGIVFLMIKYLMTVSSSFIAPRNRKIARVPKQRKRWSNITIFLLQKQKL